MISLSAVPTPVMSQPPLERNISALSANGGSGGRRAGTDSVSNDDGAETTPKTTNTSWGADEARKEEESGCFDDVRSLVRRASLMEFNNRGRTSMLSDIGGGDAGENLPQAPAPPSLKHCISTFEPNDAFTEEENAILLRLNRELKTLQDYDVIDSTTSRRYSNISCWDEETIFTMESKHRVSESIKRMSLHRLQQELQNADHDDQDPDLAADPLTTDTTNAAGISISTSANHHNKGEPDTATPTTTSLSNFLHKNNKQEKMKQHFQLQQRVFASSSFPGVYKKQNKYEKEDNSVDDISSLVRRASLLELNNQRRASMQSDITGDDDQDENLPPLPGPPSLKHCISTFEPNDAFTEEENAILLRLNRELKTLQDYDIIDSNNSNNFWDEETVFTVESKRRVSQSIKRMSLHRLQQELQQADSSMLEEEDEDKEEEEQNMMKSLSIQIPEENKQVFQMQEQGQDNNNVATAGATISPTKKEARGSNSTSILEKKRQKEEEENEEAITVAGSLDMDSSERLQAILPEVDQEEKECDFCSWLDNVFSEGMKKFNNWQLKHN